MDTAERKRRYAQEKLTVFELKFTAKDSDILAKLETVDSKQGYIRILIKNDLVRRGLMTGPVESYGTMVHKGRDYTNPYNPRMNLKLVTGGPDQPIIEYLQNCKSKIDYIRSLIRQDIDNGGSIADIITTPKSYLDVETVRASAERTSKLMTELTVQDESEAPKTQGVIDALNHWIDQHK